MYIGLFLFAKLDLAPALMWRELETAGRLQWLNFSLDPTVTFTFWAVIFGLGVSNIGSYLADQMALQRYLASESPRAAIRSFTINIVSAIVIVMTLIVIGLLLWLWYRHHPDPAAPTQPDRIVSYFIAKELPAGFSGILIAAILAATMSSMTSGINGLAGTITNDWVARLGRERTASELFKIGRCASLVIGVLTTITAGFVDRMGTILQGSQVILGLFLGPMLACMVLATLETPIRPGAMLAGLASGVGVGLLVVLSPASGLWVSPVGFATSFLVPWIFGRRIHQPNSKSIL